MVGRKRNGAEHFVIFEKTHSNGAKRAKCTSCQGRLLSINSKRALDHLLFCRRFKETNHVVLDFLLVRNASSNAGEEESSHHSREILYLVTPSSTLRTTTGEIYTDEARSYRLFSVVLDRKRTNYT